MIGTGIGLGVSGFRLPGSFFSPSKVTGLALWFDASDATTTYQSSGGSLAAANGDPVGEWRDLSGNGKHAAQADSLQKPRRITNSQQGKPGIEFPDMSDMLSLTRTTGIKHVFWVGKRYSTSYIYGASALRDSIANDKDGFTVGNFGGNHFYIQASNSGGGFVGFSAWTTISNNQTVMLEAKFDGTNGTLYRDVSTNTSSARIYDLVVSEIGGYHTGTGKFAGVMYEICAFTSTVSAENVALMQTYLRNKWGTA